MGLIEFLPSAYVSSGLSDDELRRAQEEAGALFPPDLCELLAEALPTGHGFPDWRGNPQEAMSDWRAQLIDGIHFDVMQNGFWPRAWGDRPAEPSESKKVVERQLADAPALIPIYGHRGIPNEPLLPGNPVFSVVQTDVVIYGVNLQNYFVNEFHQSQPSGTQLTFENIRKIRFWTSMLEPETF